MMTALIEIDATHMAINGGQFDSRYRYIREAISSGVVVVIPNGDSLIATRQTISGKSLCMWTWKVGGATFYCDATTAYTPNLTPPTLSTTSKDLAL